MFHMNTCISDIYIDGQFIKSQFRMSISRMDYRKCIHLIKNRTSSQYLYICLPLFCFMELSAFFMAVIWKMLKYEVLLNLKSTVKN